MKNQKVTLSIILILITFIIGILLGLLLIDVMKKLPEEAILQNNFLGFSILIVSFVIFLFASAYIQIIIHESGHLVCGLLSGYSFISFRIGKYTLVRRDKRFHIKKYYIPGTGGQCLMMPPQSREGDIPFILYNSGGVIFNFVFSLLALLFMIFVYTSVFSDIFFMAFSMVGIIYGFLNIIPMKISGITNDGYNIRMIKKDVVSRHIFYMQLRINGLQTQGMRLRYMPEDWFHISEDLNTINGFHLSMFLLRGSWYMEQFRFDEAQECLNSIRPFEQNLPGLFQLELQSELLFLEMVGTCQPDVISELYTDNIKQYLEKYQNYLFSKKRILYTYTLIVKEDYMAAENLYNDALTMKDNYPNLGEANSELDIMNHIRSLKNDSDSGMISDL